MGLREIAKRRRRRRILEAARELIGSHGLDGLSMRRLAESAQLSTRTLYNLYGAKEDILFALLSEILEELDSALDALALEDPLDRSRAVISVNVDQLTEHEGYQRSLMRELDLQPRRSREFLLIGRARALQEEALRAALRAGLIDASFSPRALAHQILLAHSQSVRLWSRGVLDAAGMRTQSLHTWALFLLAASTPASRDRLQREVHELHKHVEDIIDRMEAMATRLPDLDAPPDSA